ncbi:hypothetical protein NUM3379_14400 [Kineococcus sp. NUM-3379]
MTERDLTGRLPALLLDDVRRTEQPWQPDLDSVLAAGRRARRRRTAGRAAGALTAVAAATGAVLAGPGLLPQGQGSGTALTPAARTVGSAPAAPGAPAPSGAPAGAGTPAAVPGSQPEPLLDAVERAVREDVAPATYTVVGRDRLDGGARVDGNLADGEGAPARLFVVVTQDRPGTLLERPCEDPEFARDSCRTTDLPDGRWLSIAAGSDGGYEQIVATLSAPGGGDGVHVEVDNIAAPDWTDRARPAPGGVDQAPVVRPDTPLDAAQLEQLVLAVDAAVR